MKKIMLFASVILCAFVSKAQETKTKTDFKRFYINAGADFTDYNLTTNGYVGLAYKLKDESSVGLNLFYKNAGRQTGFVSGNGTNYGFQLQFNHDWAEKLGMNTDKFDVYTGLNLGMTFQNIDAPLYVNPYATTKITNTSYDFGGQLGIRYFIFKNIGIHLEANTNRAFGGNRLELTSNPRKVEIRTGLTFKF
jgi:hypothetical protein